MSTAVRILILVGVLVISIVSYIVCIKLAKKIDDNNTNDKHLIIIPNGLYGIALVIGIVLLFSYPNRTFLTIEKIAWISILCLLVNVSGIITLIISYGMFMKKKIGYMLIMIPALIIWAILISSSERFIENISQKSIEETNKRVVSEEVEPFITKQAKGIFVKYDDNGNVVSCKYYYIEDNNLTDNEITGEEIKDVVYIDDIEDSYIEKTETSIDYINHEMKPSSDQYSYTETTETYVLFLNKGQIAEYN